MPFKIVSENQPKGDQPQAIEKLIKGLSENKRSQVLLGVTGSGKTFTMGTEFSSSLNILKDNRGILPRVMKEIFDRIDEYETTVYTEEALHRLVEVYYILGLKNESQKYAKLLGYNYQSSGWYKKSYGLFYKNYDYFLKNELDASTYSNVKSKRVHMRNRQ